MNLHARLYQRFYPRFYGQTVPSISFLSPNFPPLCTCRENIEEIDRKNRGNSIKISRKRRGFLFVSFPFFFFSFHPYTFKSLLSSRGSRRCPTRRFSFRIVSSIWFVLSFLINSIIVHSFYRLTRSREKVHGAACFARWHLAFTARN